MPTLSLRSTVRETAEDFVLSLTARHTLVTGDETNETFDLKGRLPEEVDVVLCSDLVFSFSGFIGSSQVRPEDMLRSAVVKHFRSYLKTNSAQLGIGTLSVTALDESDKAPKFTMTSSRPLLSPIGENRILQLQSLHLVFVLRPCCSRSDFCANPFGVQSYLPLESALDCLVENFVCWHLVRRYPLIFGPWRDKFDIERGFFPIVFRSMNNMLTRSTSPSFRRDFRRLAKKLQKLIKIRSSESEHSVQQLLGHAGSNEGYPVGDLNIADHDPLCLSLERLLKQEVKPPRFKGSNGKARVFDSDIGGDDPDLATSLDAIMNSQDSEIFQEEGEEDIGEVLEDSRAWYSGQLQLDLDGDWNNDLSRTDELPMSLETPVGSAFAHDSDCSPSPRNHMDTSQEAPDPSAHVWSSPLQATNLAQKKCVSRITPRADQPSFSSIRCDILEGVFPVEDEATLGFDGISTVDAAEGPFEQPTSRPSSPVAWYLPDDFLKASQKPDSSSDHHLYEDGFDLHLHSSACFHDPSEKDGKFDPPTSGCEDMTVGSYRDSCFGALRARPLIDELAHARNEADFFPNMPLSARSTDVFELLQITDEDGVSEVDANDMLVVD